MILMRSIVIKNSFTKVLNKCYILICIGSGYIAQHTLQKLKKLFYYYCTVFYNLILILLINPPHHGRVAQ